VTVKITAAATAVAVAPYVRLDKSEAILVAANNKMNNPTRPAALAWFFISLF
jgi:hypothetical protein